MPHSTWRALGLVALAFGCHEGPTSVAASQGGTAAGAATAVAQAPGPSTDAGEAIPDGLGVDAAEDVHSAPAPASKRPGSYANVNPADDGVVGPPNVIPDCEQRLAAAGVAFRPSSIAVHRDAHAKLTCGDPQVVLYQQGPGHIAYEPQPLLTCGLALALASYERILQDEAQRAFGVPIVRIQQLGTYSCRGIVRFKGVVSEHSYANAIDLAKFFLKNGKVVSVLADFDRGQAPPPRPGGAFLRAISERGQDEDVFSNVLTPFWDAAHKDHFHCDLARYRVNGARP